MITILDHPSLADLSNDITFVASYSSSSCCHSCWQACRRHRHAVSASMRGLSVADWDGWLQKGSSDGRCKYMYLLEIVYLQLGDQGIEVLYAKDNGLASTNNDHPPTQLHPHATAQTCCLAEGSRCSEHTRPEREIKTGSTGYKKCKFTYLARMRSCYSMVPFTNPKCSLGARAMGSMAWASKTS